MKNLAQEEIKTLVMDHHGLVAATCLDLEIAKKTERYAGEGVMTFKQSEFFM